MYSGAATENDGWKNAPHGSIPGRIASWFGQLPTIEANNSASSIWWPYRPRAALGPVIAPRGFVSTPRGFVSTPGASRHMESLSAAALEHATNSAEPSTLLTEK
jgi:hypothetical protein